jgi:toxin ParE1/3/4
VKVKPVILRELASQDVDEALAYYLGEGGDSLALDFIDAIETAFRHIGAHPGSGSPRYAIELDLQDVRSWQLKRFPYVIFYIEREIEVDVWRVLHGQRDIPAWLKPGE